MDFSSLGIISDTHNNDYVIQAVLKIFKRHGVNRIVHCGDVILPEYLEYFSDIKTTVVLGNNDVEEDLKPVAARIGAIVLPQPVCMEWRGKRLFLVHGHNGGFDMAEEAFRSGEWDFVCYGHSHVAELRESQGSTILNPGSLENGDFCILTASGDLKRLNINDFE